MAEMRRVAPDSMHFGQVENKLPILSRSLVLGDEVRAKINLELPIATLQGERCYYH